MQRSVRNLVSAYLDDELRKAERSLALYRPWRRRLAAMESYAAASRADPYSERVDGGGSGVPIAQRIIEMKEKDPEYRRVARNIKAVEDALRLLTRVERDFVTSVWIDGRDARIVGELSDLTATETEEMRAHVLEIMMPELSRADDVLEIPQS